MAHFQWILHHAKFGSLNRIIDKPEVNIGRSWYADIPSKNMNVSRKHASFILTEDQCLFVKDHDTANGTYLNRRKIKPNVLVRLHESDEIVLGLDSETAVINLTHDENPNNANLIFIVKRNPVTVKTENENMDNYLDETNRLTTNTSCSAIPSTSYAEIPSTSNKNLTKTIIEDVKIKDEQKISNADDSGPIVVSDNELFPDNDEPKPDDEDANVFLKPAPVATTLKKNNFEVENVLEAENDNNRYSNEDLLRILAASQFEGDDNSIEKTNGDVELNNQTIKEEIKCNYTIDDEFIVVSDDDENVQYSQVLDDYGTDANRNIDDHGLNDSLFNAIKKEVEELDKLPDGTVFSRICIDEDDGNWLSELAQDENNKSDQSHLEVGIENEIIKSGDNELEKLGHNKIIKVDSNYKIKITNETEPKNNNSKKLVEGKNEKHFKYHKEDISENVEFPIVLLNSIDDYYKDGNGLEEKRTSTKTIETKCFSNNSTNNGLKNNKRKPIENEIFQIKKIKTTNFYNSKTPTPKSTSLVNKEHVKEIRKRKLREIAIKEKSPQDSKDNNFKRPLHLNNVKVSDNSSKRLVYTEAVPSTSKGPVTRNSAVNEINKGTLHSKKTIPIIAPHSMVKKRPPSKKLNTASPKVILQKMATESSSETSRNAISRRIMKTYEELEDIITEIMQWNPIWFNEYLKSPQWGLPQYILKNLQPMINSFSSYDQYYKVVIPQMMMELWYFFYKEVESFSDRKKKFSGILQQEKRIPHKYTQLNYCSLINKYQNDNHLHVKEDDILIIQYRRLEGTVTKAKIVLGYVIKVYKQLIQDRSHIDQKFVEHIEIEPHAMVNFQVLVKSSIGDAIVGSYSQIRITTSVVSTMRIFKSVYRLKDSLLQAHILRPTAELYQIPPMKKQEIYSKEVLNEAQKKVVVEASRMCLRNMPGIYLIQGPPGTGKTTVILNIIQQILFHPNNSSHKCILVVAPSNGAVDELAIRIMGLKPKFTALHRKLKLVRMGPKNMIHPKVQDYLLYEIAKRNLNSELMKTVSQANLQLLDPKYKAMMELRELANSKSADNVARMKFNTAKVEFDNTCKRLLGGTYNDQLKKHELVLLQGAEILCTTLSSCVGLRMEEVFGRSSKNKITCCIVDEATQSNEQETLIPLILGVDKLVLVGDPKQLPAVTQTKEAKDYGYGKSLFSRIMSNFPSDQSNPVQLLNIQYRMHPAISQFPNVIFYNRQLVDAPSVQRRKSRFNVLKPYLVFNFDMGTIMNSQEYSNKAELLCVFKLLNALSAKFKDNLTFNIGIITPYNNQKAKINDELKSKRFVSNVTVNTVDSFQGQEKDIIIVSCVRENTNLFLTDEQRLNVALTRAKYGLYIIGASNLFKSSGIFGIIREDAYKRNLFINVNSRTSESQLLNHISKR